MRLNETKAPSNKDLSGKKVNYVCEKKEVENHQPTVNYIKSLTGFDIKSFD